MKALDLFCCDGGAAVGLQRAGFDVVGIDINKHHDYPFDFIQGDATKPPVKMEEFDFIWASPPCQMFSTATTPRKHGQRCRHGKYQNLIPQTRHLLKESGKPFCIENVPKAPLRADLTLCGKMFNLKVYRHRIFELNGFRAEQPRHPPHIWSTWKGEVFTICGDTPLVPGHGDNKIQRRLHREKLNKTIFKGDITKLWKDAMGITHINNRLNLTEAIPPAYSEYIGREFMRTTSHKTSMPEK